KNIARPVRAFRVRTADNAAQKRRKIGRWRLLYGAPAVAAALAVTLGIVGAWGALDYLGSAPALTAGLLRIWPGSSSTPAQRAPPLSIVVLRIANIGGD